MATKRRITENSFNSLFIQFVDFIDQSNQRDLFIYYYLFKTKKRFLLIGPDNWALF